VSVTIQALFTDTADSLSLAWVDGECGAGRCFLENLREPADMVGYLNLIHPNRLHDRTKLPITSDSMHRGVKPFLLSY
jgi:hypothetical protein